MIGLQGDIPVPQAETVRHSAKGRWIDDWDPENEEFWERVGKRVARRNLVWSILAEHIGFSVWLSWSVVAARLPAAGFPYTTDQLFALVALPGLVGALVRFPYTFAVPKFGGRNWTLVSALLLLIPTLSLIVLVQRPSTPLWCMQLAAATAGLGGGNFSSSMTNISFFFPDRQKGWALGLNAAGGNIGVSSVQLVVPLVVGYGLLPGSTQKVHLENAGLIWLLPILVATIGAWFYMDNLSQARSSFKDQVVVGRRAQTWIMSFLYVGTFGSFVGFSAAFPLLLKTQFPSVTANIAFLGALVGSLSRPFGGWLADKFGGARITFINFFAMALGSVGVLAALGRHDIVLFLVAFLALFVTTGIGNGSTFRMIPVIFRAVHGVDQQTGEARAAAAARARRESAAVIGIAAAIGALGGYFIPRSFAASIKASGGPMLAVKYFLAFYLLCCISTWWFYMRRRFLTKLLPSLAEAKA
ncbi:MAG TPA: MFS transporter [Polyangiaceae bacterium]|nr:MFS transporter [Polyangiaceae bacterium]